MDRDEAALVLADALTRYEGRGHAELARSIGQVDAYAVTGPSGAEYQVEIDVLWDDRPGGAIRVLASVDDGSLRASFRPVSDDLLIAPDEQPGG